MDIFKFVIVAYLTIGTIVAVDSHHPEVREDFMESASGIVKTFQKPDNIQTQFSPPIFEYGKVAQPDLRKWRYYQQQQADSKNMANAKERLESNGLFKKAFHFRTQYIPTISTPAEANLQPRWKIVHPKFVTERQNDVSPMDAMNMNLRRRDSKKIVLIVPPKTIIKVDRPSNRKQDYSVRETDDLDVEASENYERVETQNHGAFLPPGIVYKPADQNDITALNSLLGQSPSAQLQGLQQLLHSQSTHAAPMTQNAGYPTNAHAGEQTLLQGGQILAKPQDISKLQAQLDALTQNQAQKALLEAQQQADEHIRKQHEALERIKIEGQRIALAHIQAQNMAIAQPVHQHEAPKPTEQANLVEESTHQHLTVQSGHDQAPVAQALTGTVDHNEAINHAVLQAQTYLQLSAPNHNSHGAQVQNVDYSKNQYNSYGSYGYPGGNSAQNQEVRAYIKQQPQETQGLDHSNNQFSSYGAYGYQRGNNAVLPNQGSGEHIQQHPQQTQGLDHSNNQFSLYGAANSQQQQPPAVEVQSLDHSNNQFSSYGAYGYPGGTNAAVATQDDGEHINEQQPQEQPSLSKISPTPTAEDHNQEDDTQDAHEEEQHDEYAPQYKFGYRIMDYHSGNDYGHEESREGKMTKGQYHTLLPDGRVQNVVYWAGPSGYHAKVTYSNVARH